MYLIVIISASKTRQCHPAWRKYTGSATKVNGIKAEDIETELVIGAEAEEKGWRMAGRLERFSA